MLTITYQLLISTTAITNIIKHLLTEGEAKQNTNQSIIKITLCNYNANTKLNTKCRLVSEFVNYSMKK